jgi:hypothetical protein
MPRQRKHLNAAERQAAFRARRDDKQAVLTDTVYQLYEAVWEAGQRGDELALSCHAFSAPATLAKLTEAFKQRPTPVVGRDSPNTQG